MVTIRPMIKNDINAVSLVHTTTFSRQLSSNKWISCNFNSYPRILMYVAVSNKDEIVGYIQWVQKSGFRKEAVLELEQIAVLPNYQGKNIGKMLINQSLELVKEFLADNGSMLKSIMVTTRTDNAAQHLYEKTLGAKATAVIKNLYSADEVVMVATYI